MRTLFLTFICLMQGLYYFVTGIWPLFGIRSFLRVTGIKIDLWLVKTIGALVMTIGVVLFFAAIRGEVNFEIALLAVGSAMTLTAVDVYYVGKNVISPIYMADALLEILMVAGWLICLGLSFILK